MYAAQAEAEAAQVAHANHASTQIALATASHAKIAAAKVAEANQVGKLSCRRDDFVIPTTGEFG